jgi:prepilin-type N-terminal cleavage/methylation domain-containing protein
MRAAMSNNGSRSGARPASARSEAGFTMIEMVIAMMIMLIGLLGMAEAISYGLMVSNSGRNVTNTKLLVVSVLEQMETLRNTKELTFGQISNTGQVDDTGSTRAFAGFPTGFTSVSINPGPDGVFGTADDLIDAGPDQTYGTSDDFTNQALVRPGFQRQIRITSLSSDLKKIEVTLRYPGRGGQYQTMTAISYLNNDARNNYRP